MRVSGSHFGAVEVWSQRLKPAAKPSVWLAVHSNDEYGGPVSEIIFLDTAGARQLADLLLEKARRADAGIEDARRDP